MKYCEKCLVKNGNFDFFVMTLQTSCGAFRQRERVTLQTSCGAERVNQYGIIVLTLCVSRFTRCFQEYNPVCK